MRHYGDITQLKGYELPVVDCITGGSPCQDLSVAGKRAGLDGERSGLFMEQVRIVKEMRDHDRANGRTGYDIRPRFMVWENVPGAFSSNGGRDFKAVLTEIVRIAEADAPDVPMPDKGKWTKSGCLYDELGRWSVAWRVHDAQFWGVPQRRKRIALVADFGGLIASEVLFERKGLRGDFEESETERKGTAGDVEIGINGSIAGTQDASYYKGCGERNGEERDKVFDAHQYHGWREGETCGTLTAGQNNCVRGETPLVVLNDQGGGIMDCTEEKTATLRAQEHGHQPVVLDARWNGDGKTAPTLTGDHQNRITDYTAITVENVACIGNGQVDQLKISEKVGALNCMHDQQAIIKSGTVRRLTPLECERLQGYPDNWTNIGEWIDTKGKKHKEADSPRYKALGNSIALPFWFWLLRRISAQYERPATLGSLFDGIGGFPLCWERCNGKGTALWASEIEEFPIAVTKKHFPEGVE